MIHDFINIDYLKNGNQIQRKSYKIIQKIELFSILKDHKPILTGTIPIDINIEESDLDVICEVNDFDSFRQKVEKHFSEYDGFSYSGMMNRNDKECVTFNFFVDGMEIELYGENKPAAQQNAYRHMLIEYHFLNKLGDDFKKKIIALKKAGLKTEPAFAKLLNLEGDPYEALLNVQL
ncbi:DUF4269 domain-containing protein [Flammeovirga yaeyamensis]|uniref:DUF4269 domain-containing protein n=1 Tax=Flammeovirga yaeyamensis TaxID=367791 RepID=A0AAX1N7J4_9BACT|nr:DUF4269 domain-containing protein [Flammeovirga yaeyamensis]MBB3698037.1 hypothetical protein [Flammeovirga yaeyamensis]NMF35611.1 DUF4269 domain-containing protein [Flammeovirga yaeyamensis]QWG03432.1 DUF4269 domain-containing protein [Flammeovirga yaeyamensis]